MKTDKRSKKLKGVVVSDASDKTVVVEVSRFVKHPKYRKYVKQSKKYKAHDPENAHTAGERVTIEECRPVSKDKRFRVVSKSE